MNELERLAGRVSETEGDLVHVITREPGTLINVEILLNANNLNKQLQELMSDKEDDYTLLVDYINKEIKDLRTKQNKCMNLTDKEQALEYYGIKEDMKKKLEFIEDALKAAKLLNAAKKKKEARLKQIDKTIADLEKEKERLLKSESDQSSTKKDNKFKFRKGDKVVCIEENGWVAVGDKGIVDEDDDIPCVNWENDKRLAVRQRHLELAEEQDNE